MKPEKSPDSRMLL